VELQIRWGHMPLAEGALQKWSSRSGGAPLLELQIRWGHLPLAEGALQKLNISDRASHMYIIPDSRSRPCAIWVAIMSFQPSV